MAAILVTSLLGPDAEFRWANWLKLLLIPQSLILYRSPKIVTKFTRDHFFGPFDIDYFKSNDFCKYICIKNKLHVIKCQLGSSYSKKNHPKRIDGTFTVHSISKIRIRYGAPRGFGDLGRMAIYFQAFGEQVHSFGDLGIPAKKVTKSHLKGKAFILFDFFFSKKFFGRPHPRPP